MDGTRRWLEDFIWSVRATIAISLLLLLVYGLQLAIAGSLRSDVAHQVIQTWIRPNWAVYLLVSPLVHSFHGHVLGNLTLLIPSGALTERVVPRRSYVAFVYVAGVLSNFLPPFLGLGGLGVGISGAFYGLWTIVGVVYMTKALSPGPIRWMIPYLLVSILGLFLAFMGVLEWAGYEPAAPNTATGAHLLGVVLGFSWAVGWIFTSRLGSEVPVLKRV